MSNYMWEYLLQADENGLRRDDVSFVPLATPNPYRETASYDFNRSSPVGKPVEVNAYYRYGEVFGWLLGENMDAHAELRLVLFDIVAHYLSELDLRSGLCRDEYYSRFLQNDVLRGVFGTGNAQKMQCFSIKQRKLIFAEYLRVNKVGTSVKFFAQLLRELYPNSITYFDTCYGRELLIYLGMLETPMLAAQIEFLTDLFVPIDCTVRLFWDMHFGLIGTDETMQIDNIMIF